MLPVDRPARHLDVGVFGHDGSDCFGADAAGVSDQALRGERSGASVIVGLRSCIVSTWLEGEIPLTGQSHGRLHPLGRSSCWQGMPLRSEGADVFGLEVLVDVGSDGIRPAARQARYEKP